MGTPPAADDSVCPERNVVRESRAAPPTKIAFQVHRFFHFNKYSPHGELQHNCKIACQVLKINVHLSILLFHKKFSRRVFLEWDIPTKLRESRDKGERRGKSDRRGFQGSTGFLGVNGDF